MFMAIKERFEGRSFDNWAEDIKLRWEYSMEYYKKELSEEIEFYEFVQYEFYRQWYKLKKICQRQWYKNYWRYSNICGL